MRKKGGICAFGGGQGPARSGRAAKKGKQIWVDGGSHGFLVVILLFCYFVN
jgi:hypothetical protein